MQSIYEVILNLQGLMTTLKIIKINTRQIFKKPKTIRAVIN